jgi:hypothetical protein
VALRTVVTAAEAEMNDDTALREQLLAAEMERELGRSRTRSLPTSSATCSRAFVKSRNGAKGVGPA